MSRFYLLLLTVALACFAAGCGGDDAAPVEDSADIHPCLDASMDLLGVQPSELRAPTAPAGATAPATAAAPNDGSGFGSGVPGCDGPDFSQRCALWGADEYDHGRAQDIGCGSNIAQCGCAMTSAASLLLRHGVTRGPDGQPTTPKTLNEWLKAEARETRAGIVTRGYVYGGVNWLAVAQYSRLAAERFGTPALSFAGTLGADTSALRREVENGRPVILEQPGHFILATSAATSGITISDPFYADRTSLNTPAYKDTFLSGRLYRPSPDASAMMIAAPKGVGFRIQDANGQVTGFKAGASTPVGEIRQSAFSRESAWRDPTCTAAPPRDDAGVDMALLWQPAGGNYKVEVFGDAGEDFSLSIYAYDQAGGLTLRTFDGDLPASGVVVIDVDYTPVPGGEQSIDMEGAGPGPAAPTATSTQAPAPSGPSPTPAATATAAPATSTATPARRAPATRTPTPPQTGPVTSLTLTLAPSSAPCNDPGFFAVVTAIARDATGKQVPTPLQFSADAGKLTPTFVNSSTGIGSVRFYPGELAPGTSVKISVIVPGIVAGASDSANFFCTVLLGPPLLFPVN